MLLKPYSAWSMAGPMIRLVFWAVLGTTLGFLGGSFFVWWLVAILGLSFWFFIKTPARTTALYLALLAAFAAGSSLERSSGSGLKEEYTRGPILMEAVVCADPIVREANRKGEIRVSIPVRATHYRFSQWRPLQLRVSVEHHANSAWAIPSVGQTLMISGKPLWRDGPGMGIWKSSLRLYTGENQLVVLDKKTEGGLLKWALTIRDKLSETLNRGLEDYDHQRLIIQALLLGYRSELPDELRSLFAGTGTMHVFAISGLHVGVISLLIIALLRSLRVPIHRWAWILFPALFFFVLATGFRASALRALIMATVYFLAPVLYRRSNGFAAWSAAGMLVLALAPNQLLDLGFQYSFIIVFGLMVLYPVLEKLFMPYLGDDPFRLPGINPWRDFSFGILERVGQLFCISLAAWLCSIPLSWLFFNSVSWVAVPANLLVVPGTFLTVVSGVLSLMVAPHSS